MTGRFLATLALLYCGWGRLRSCPQNVSDSCRSRLETEVRISPGRTLSLDEYVKRWLKTKEVCSVSAQLNITPPNDGYALDYNHPTFSAGLRYNFNHRVRMHRDADPAWGDLVPVSYDSRLGNVLTLYATFSRPFFRLRRWQAGYYLGMGIGYSAVKYSTVDCIDNELIGSHLNIYFTAGLYARYQVSSDIAVTGGIDFAHHSNGALYRPNKGANYLGPFIGLAYCCSSGNTPSSPATSPAASVFQRYTFVELSAGGGGKTLLEDWQRTQFHTPIGQPGYRTSKFPVYGAFSFQTSFMYRYARRWASGIGIVVFYGDYSDKVARIDAQAGYTGELHSPWSVALSARHEAFYGRLSARMGVGYYLYRHAGHSAREVEKPYYECIGLFYSFPRLHDIAIGFNVNAHATKADFTELRVDIPFRLGKRR